MTSSARLIQWKDCLRIVFVLLFVLLRWCSRVFVVFWNTGICFRTADNIDNQNSRTNSTGPQNRNMHCNTPLFYLQKGPRTQGVQNRDLAESKELIICVLVLVSHCSTEAYLPEFGEFGWDTLVLSSLMYFHSCTGTRARRNIGRARRLLAMGVSFVSLQNSP